MIDFRYHAVSIVAVFTALAIGLLLGASLNETGVGIENVRGTLERSLKDDLRKAQAGRRTAQDAVSNRDDFLAGVFPRLVRSDLRGLRIGVVGTGKPTEETLKHVNSATRESGGRLMFAAQIRDELDYSALARDLGLKGKPVGEALAQQIGRAAGRRLVRGRDRDFLRSVFGRFSGSFARIGAVVFVRSSGTDAGDVEAKRRDAFQRGLLSSLRSSRRNVVGVEPSDVEQSQIDWYRQSDLSTVDNVDQYAGKYSLVQLLAGAEGDFGIKKTADAPAPIVAR